MTYFKQLLFRKENLLLILPLIVIALNQLILGKTALDIHVHDTYIIFPQILFNILLVLYCFVIYFFLWLIKKKRRISNWIFYIQLFGLIMLALLISQPVQFLNGMGMPRRYYDYEYQDSFHFFGISNQLINILINLSLLSQIIFFIYFVISIFKTQKQKTTNQKPSTSLPLNIPAVLLHILQMQLCLVWLLYM